MAIKNHHDRTAHSQRVLQRKCHHHHTVVNAWITQLISGVTDSVNRRDAEDYLGLLVDCKPLRQFSLDRPHLPTLSFVPLLCPFRDG
jgi:hypothetical protein